MAQKTVPWRRKKPTLKDGSVPERLIQAQILSWLKSAGILMWRQNSGVVFAGGRRILLGEDGLPDIVVIVPPGGRMLGLEVKSAKGTLRPSQKAFRERMEATGAMYSVVRTLGQAKDAVAQCMGEEQWKLLPSLAGSKKASEPAYGPN